MTPTEALAGVIDSIIWDIEHERRAATVPAIAARLVDRLARAYQATTAGHGLSYPSALAWAGELIEALGADPE